MLLFIVYLSALFTAETQGMSVRTEALSLGVYNSNKPHGLGAWRQAASHFLENLFSEFHPWAFTISVTCGLIRNASSQSRTLMRVRPKNQCFKKPPTVFDIHYKTFHPPAVVSVDELPLFLLINVKSQEGECMGIYVYM